MKMTMREKICVLIGKYEEKEQQELVKVAGGAFCVLLNKKPSREQENASAMASIYHWIQEDLKKLLEEDDSKPEGCCKCHADAEEAGRRG